MPSPRLKEFLDSNNVKYVTIIHSLAFTALDIAQSAHIPARELAKTVIIKINGDPTMVVVPAAYRVKLDLLREAFDTPNVELASEREFSNLFPDCEVGAMPPFGNLYDLPVFVAESLTEDNEIAFNAGSHSEVVKIAYRDYESLVQPSLVVLAN